VGEEEEEEEGSSVERWDWMGWESKWVRARKRRIVYKGMGEKIVLK